MIKINVCIVPVAYLYHTQNPDVVKNNASVAKVIVNANLPYLVNLHGVR